ncbi:DUF802 domain-containing protein [Trinickia sp.]|uniref:DUF802 domain-containing protein n=1 Tax=Trinickia sp. TaxID=2571163 RepID=UPI003F7D3316
MSRQLLNIVVFSLGLLAVCWVGAGYLGSNPLALALTLLVGACYLAGAFELRRYSEATATLARTVDSLTAPPASLAACLDPLPPSLRHSVRLRIEGERVALPGPALTPYLVGLLVLLGMLGTLLGMAATLRGTGMALDSAADLQAIRASLAAPVKGLGFAFGTSIAGVATSAMLGLLSALCRRERIHAAHKLDVKIATTLRAFSQSYQREETFKLLQRQAQIMPALVDRLQTMMSAIEQHSAAANERQLANQNAFHREVETAYTRLAASVEQSLKKTVTDSARAAGAALQPVVEATMASLAQETASLHDVVTRAVDRQLDGLSTSLRTTTQTVSDIWNQALAEHRQSSETIALHLNTSLAGFTETFEQRSAGLVQDVAARLDATAGNLSDAWATALSQQAQLGDTLAQRNREALQAAAATFEQHSAALLRNVDRSHAQWQAALASRDEERLAAWTGTLGSMATALTQQWEAVGARTADRQQDICNVLAQTAREMSADARTHAAETIAEIARLVQAASEAPKAAAEVVAELRQKLSDSMVRDTAMLEERSRLLATLETLLDAVNHASTEQRSAVDALVATSANLLERVGNRFAETIDAETGKLGTVAAQVTGSAVEVASLGDAFGAAVQSFGQSNETLVAHLARIEAALDKSLARSDEQLAYYVAQAREIIDLSMMSHKQIIEDMQQLAGQRASAGAAAA